MAPKERAVLLRSSRRKFLKILFAENCGQALRLTANKKQESNFPEFSSSVPPTGVDRTKQAVVYKGDMKREWPRMRQMEKNSGRHRLAAHATLPDGRNRLQPLRSCRLRRQHLEQQHGARTALRVRMAAQRFRDRSWLAPNFTPLAMPRGQEWMTAQARFGTLAPASEARRVKMIICTTPRGSARGPGRKVPVPAVQKSGVGGAGPEQAYRISLDGLSVGQRTSSWQRQTLVRRHAGFGLPANVEAGMAKHGAPVFHIVRGRHAAPGQIVNDARLVRDGEPKHVDGRAG